MFMLFNSKDNNETKDKKETKDEYNIDTVFEDLEQKEKENENKNKNENENENENDSDTDMYETEEEVETEEEAEADDDEEYVPSENEEDDDDEEYVPSENEEDDDEEEYVPYSNKIKAEKSYWEEDENNNTELPFYEESELEDYIQEKKWEKTIYNEKYKDIEIPLLYIEELDTTLKGNDMVDMRMYICKENGKYTVSGRRKSLHKKNKSQYPIFNFKYDKLHQAFELVDFLIAPGSYVNVTLYKCISGFDYGNDYYDFTCARTKRNEICAYDMIKYKRRMIKNMLRFL